MKKSVTIILLALGMSFYSFTQGKNKLPEEVKIAFEKKFPYAEKTKWNKGNDKEWEVEFMIKNKFYSCNFLSDGSWKDTETALRKEELPKEILNSFRTVYPNYKIEKLIKLESVTGIIYKIIATNNKETLEFIYSVEGKLVDRKEVLLESK